MNKLEPNTKMIVFWAYMSICHQIKQILNSYSFKEIVTNDISEKIFLPKQLHYSLFEMIIGRDHII